MRVRSEDDHHLPARGSNADVQGLGRVTLGVLQHLDAGIPEAPSTNPFPGSVGAPAVHYKDLPRLLAIGLALQRSQRIIDVIDFVQTGNDHGNHTAQR